MWKRADINDLPIIIINDFFMVVIPMRQYRLNDSLFRRTRESSIFLGNNFFLRFIQLNVCAAGPIHMQQRKSFDIDYSVAWAMRWQQWLRCAANQWLVVDCEMMWCMLNTENENCELDLMPIDFRLASKHHHPTVWRGSMTILLASTNSFWIAFVIR